MNLNKYKNNINNDIIENLKNQPNRPFLVSNSETRELATLVNENDEIFIKKLITNHLDDKGKKNHYCPTNFI